MAEALSAVAEIIRINADAVAPDESGMKAQEVPFRAGRLEHVEAGQAQLGEDLGDLVHEGDVDVALGIFDHLRRLGGAYRFGPKGARAGDPSVDRSNSVRDVVILSGNHLHDTVDAMLAIAGIHA